VSKVFLLAPGISDSCQPGKILLGSNENLQEETGETVRKKAWTKVWINGEWKMVWDEQLPDLPARVRL
jgi:hypothetical protein